jgi:hypothetical protein
MAADLASDLAEAEAEGVAAEEVLGNGAFDPRSFAASWAAERGVIHPAPVRVDPLPRRPRLPAAIVAFALIAIIGTVLAILASRSGPGLVTVAAPGIGRVTSQAPPRSREVVPRERLVQPPPPARFRVVPLPASGSVDLRRIGVLLLLAGLVGAIFSTVFWLGTGPAGWSRRRARIDELRTGRSY